MRKATDEDEGSESNKVDWLICNTVLVHWDYTTSVGVLLVILTSKIGILIFHMSIYLFTYNLILFLNWI